MHRRSEPRGFDATISARYDWPLQLTSFPLRHWNLRNLTLQTSLSITRDFFRLHSTLARLYNAAASAASRLCSAGSLAIIKHNFIEITKMSRLYSFFNLFSKISASRKISQQNSLKITIICETAFTFTWNL